MKENENDILNEAIADLRDQAAAPPPPDVLDETIARLAEAATASIPTTHADIAHRIWPLARLAVAATILVFVGFSFGRAARDEPIDLAQLEQRLAPSIAASLEPAIREKLAVEITQRYEIALADSYHRVRQELTEQHRDEMNRLAVQTLAASNAVTNRLLADLMDTIKTEKTRDLRSVAAALQRIDQRRVEDREMLSTSLAHLAHETDSRLRQTKGELVQLLVDTQPNDLRVVPHETFTDPNERN
jgi:hypothetical protein